MDGACINWSTQERISVSEPNIETQTLEDENKKLKEELEFHKSLFKTHNNSCLFNIHIKTIKGQKVWIDKVRDSHKFPELDIDDEVREWLKPVKCER